MDRTDAKGEESPKLSSLQISFFVARAPERRKSLPQCKVPLGHPYWYRVFLAVAGLCVGAYVMYAGYTGPDASGWR